MKAVVSGVSGLWPAGRWRVTGDSWLVTGGKLPSTAWRGSETRR